MEITTPYQQEWHLINLTPHDIRIYVNDEDYWLIKKSGEIARLDQFDEQDINCPVCTVSLNVHDWHEDVAYFVPTTRTVYGAVSNLPETQDGRYYIVSQMVASHVLRTDVLSPDTGPTAVRDEKGAILGVRRLQRWG